MVNNMRIIYKKPIPWGKGAARNSKSEYIRFLYIALGSLAELETQLIIAGKLNYSRDNKKFLGEIESLTRKTYSLINYLKSKVKSI